VRVQFETTYNRRDPMTLSLNPAQFGNDTEAQSRAVGRIGVPLWVDVSRSHGVVHVIVGGQLDTATAADLARLVERVLVNGTARHIVIDVSGVAFIDLHGLRALEKLVANLGAPSAVDVVPGAALVRLRSVLQRVKGYAE
jgi:anti-anti-sigma factor